MLFGLHTNTFCGNIGSREIFPSNGAGGKRFPRLPLYPCYETRWPFPEGRLAHKIVAVGGLSKTWKDKSRNTNMPRINRLCRKLERRSDINADRGLKKLWQFRSSGGAEDFVAD